LALEQITLDIDASLLTAHSEEGSPAGNYKGGFGFHPLLCYLAGTGEAPDRRLLSVFDCASGYRHTAFITDRADSDVAALELRRRRRARLEDAIRVGKETGMAKLPFAAFAHNEAWLEVSLAAQALLRWASLFCLQGELALTEPKRTPQRLLHVAGRIVRSGRRVALRLPRSWSWPEALVAAFARLRALAVASSP